MKHGEGSISRRYKELEASVAVSFQGMYCTCCCKLEASVVNLEMNEIYYDVLS